MAESFAAGAKVGEVAQRHGLNASVLSTWRRDVMPNEVPGTEQTATASTALPGFVPVSVFAQDKQPAGSVPAADPAVGVIEITLGDARIRVTSGVDAATLSLVLAAVRRGGR